MYEIYFAQKLVEGNSFEILSWTSDKGFENGVPVANNGDPDFLIRYKNNGLIVSVECKYRSNFFSTSPNKIEWGYTRQAKRYADYNEKFKRPVFIANGIKGTPDNPKFNYLVELNYLLKISNGEYFNGDKTKKEQQVATQRAVFDFLIKRNDFPGNVIALIQDQIKVSLASVNLASVNKARLD